MTSNMATAAAETPTRRQMIQLLASIGITGPLALELSAQSSGRVSIETLRRASEVLGEAFTAERLAVLEKAVQRNLDQMQVVRDLVIDDRVEPAPIFMAKQGAVAPSQRPRGGR